MRPLRSLRALIFLVGACASQSFDYQMLYDQGRYPEAEAAARAAIAARRSEGNAQAVLCASLVRQSRHREALEIGLAILESQQFEWRVIESVAECYFALGDNEKSLSYYTSCFAYAGDRKLNPAAYYALGELYIRMGGYEHADIALSAALHLAPRKADWWARLGYARMRLKNWAPARQAYSTALSLDPSNADAKAGLAELSRMGR
jgi:tetratricopeptide (TPR) repeat protein